MECDPLLPSPQGWNSVRQGKIGDCYFLCALITVAKWRAQAIRGLIEPAPEGGYWVAFHGRPSLWVDGLGLPGGVTSEGVWARVLEQAWETHKGNLRPDGTVKDFGWSGSAAALKALTGDFFGERSGNLTQRELGPRLTREIIEQVARRREVTVATGGISSLWAGPQPGMARNHIYAVVDVDGEGNLLICNPWGHEDHLQWLNPWHFSRCFNTATLPGSSDFKGVWGQRLFGAAEKFIHLALDARDDWRNWRGRRT